MIPWENIVEHRNVTSTTENDFPIIVTIAFCTNIHSSRSKLILHTAIGIFLLVTIFIIDRNLNLKV